MGLKQLHRKIMVGNYFQIGQDSAIILFTSEKWISSLLSELCPEFEGIDPLTYL